LRAGIIHSAARLSLAAVNNFWTAIFAARNKFRQEIKRPPEAGGLRAWKRNGQADTSAGGGGGGGGGGGILAAALALVVSFLRFR